MTSQTTEVLSPIDVRSAITEIGQAWHKATQSILETANLLFEFSLREGWDELRSELNEQKVMNTSVISMLLGIARNPMLMSPDVRDVLPPSYNTLYQLSNLEEDVLSEKIEQGDIYPTMQLSEARNLVAQYATKTAKSSKRQKSVSVAISMKFTDPKGYKGKVQSALKLLKEHFPDVEVKANI